MDKISFCEIESKYSELTQLKNSSKCEVYLVQSAKDGRIYIKKELKNYNIDVYKQIKNINNRYISKIYEVFKCDEVLIVIEEFINGQTLQHIIDNEGPLKEDIAISYISNLCEALDELHNQNPPIIHRDIKPSNIIIDNNGILKLIDFDVSRVYKDEKNMDTYILGTKGYASPEQFGFDQTDCRSDIYSLGIVLNVLTTGKHIKEKLNDGRLKEIIEKATNIAPEKRYSSVKELMVAVNNTINTEESIKYDNVVNDEESNDILGDTDINIVYDNQCEESDNILSDTDIDKVNDNHYKEIDDVENNLNNKEDSLLYEEEMKENSSSHRASSKNRFISIIRTLPGFRGRNPIKIITAFLWYSFLLFGLTINWGSGNITLIIEDLLMVLFFLAVTLFNFNYNNIKSKLPLIRGIRLGRKISGTVIYNFIIFLILGVLLEVFKLM